MRGDRPWLWAGPGPTARLAMQPGRAFMLAPLVLRVSPGAAMMTPPQPAGARRGPPVDVAFAPVHGNEPVHGLGHGFLLEAEPLAGGLPLGGLGAQRLDPDRGEGASVHLVERDRADLGVLGHAAQRTVQHSDRGQGLLAR